LERKPQMVDRINSTRKQIEQISSKEGQEGKTIKDKITIIKECFCLESLTGIYFYTLFFFFRSRQT